MYEKEIALAFARLDPSLLSTDHSSIGNGFNESVKRWKEVNTVRNTNTDRNTNTVRNTNTDRNTNTVRNTNTDRNTNTNSFISKCI